MRTVYFKMVNTDTISVEMTEAEASTMQDKFTLSYGKDDVINVIGMFSFPARQVIYMSIGIAVK